MIHRGVWTLVLAIVLMQCGCGAKREATPVVAPSAADAGQPSVSPDDEIPRPQDLGSVREQRLLTRIEEAQEAIRQAPQSAAAWGALGHVYLAHDWGPEAAACYERAAELAPREFKWHYFLGRSLSATDLERARAALGQASLLDPSYAPAKLFLAQGLRDLGEVREAERHFQGALQLDGKLFLAELGLAEIRLEAKDYQAARRHLQRCLELDAEQSRAHALMARVCAALGEPEAAWRHAERAKHNVTRVPLYDPLWQEVQAAGVTASWMAVRGAIHLHNGQFEDAVRELEAAIAEGEDKPEVLLNYGIALWRVGRLDDAIRNLEQAQAKASETGFADITPDVREKILINLGIAHGMRREAEPAESFFREALALNPGSTSALNNLAVLAFQSGQLDAAIVWAERSREIQATSDTLRLLGSLYRAAGRTSDAEAIDTTLRQP